LEAVHKYMWNRAASLVLTTAALGAVACSTESRHRTVIYDQTWSRAAGVRNLFCAPDLKSSCEREAREDEAPFQESFPQPFERLPNVRPLSLSLLRQMVGRQLNRWNAPRGMPGLSIGGFA
jgi:hypothetical protein